MESATESEELARKGASERGAGKKCEEEDSTRPVFDGLTCSGLDAGMEIEDFINETVEEGKSEKLVLEEQAKVSSAFKGSLEEPPRTTTTTTTMAAAKAGEAAAAAATPSCEIVAEKTSAAMEVVVVEHEDTTQEQVGKVEEKKGLESSAVAANAEEPQRKLAITTTAGENEETIDGAALSSVQRQVDDSNTTTPRTEDQGDKTDATKSSEPEVVEVAAAAAANAPKSCVVNMASDDNSGGKKEKPPNAGASKSNGSAARSKKNQADQTSSQAAAVEGEAAAATAKTPAKRGRKPGSKRADKAATESSPKSRSSSGESIKVPQVTLDLTTQPFSDAQQIQLRAQILVYGAIIQGSLADENLMGAAFTDISKVRNLESFESQAAASKAVWEKTWRAASERVLKSSSTPKFAGRNSPPALRRPLSPGNLPKSPSGKGKKTAATSSSPPTTVTTNAELPSVSPITTSAMNMASATVASWNSARARAPPPPPWSTFPFNVPAGVPSQFSSPLRGNWGVFSQGPFAVQAPFASQPPGFPLFSSPPQGASPPPAAAAGSPPPGEDDRSKGKRKRLEQDATPSTTEVANEVANDVDISPATAGLLENLAPEKLQKLRRPELEKLGREDLVQRLESAKNKAEEAASAASSMVEQSQTVWDELKEKRRSKNISSREAQLASSLAAASAAASVAKAAAAAASVAYAAALQARAMASEIVGKEAEADSDPTVTHVTQGDESAAMKSAIAGAKVAIKDRAEAAALALRRAENLEAVVRAAELAAQAASQAGEVMAIGDPASLASCEKSPRPPARASGKRNARPKAAAKKRSKSTAADEQGALAKNHVEEVSAEGEGDANQGNEEAMVVVLPKGDEGGASKSGAAQGDVVDAEPSEGLVEDKQQGKEVEIVVGSHVETRMGCKESGTRPRLKL